MAKMFIYSSLAYRKLLCNFLILKMLSVSQLHYAACLLGHTVVNNIVQQGYTFVIGPFFVLDIVKIQCI